VQAPYLQDFEDQAPKTAQRSTDNLAASPKGQSTSWGIEGWWEAWRKNRGLHKGQGKSVTDYQRRPLFTSDVRQLPRRKVNMDCKIKSEWNNISVGGTLGMTDTSQRRRGCIAVNSKLVNLCSSAKYPSQKNIWSRGCRRTTSIAIEGYESPTTPATMEDNPTPAASSRRDHAVPANGDNPRNQRGDRNRGGRGRGRGGQQRGRGKGFGSNDSGERHRKRDIGRGEYK